MSDGPMAGLLRVLYFLALGIAMITFAVTFITSVYGGPSNDVGGGVASVFANSEEEDYNRNLGFIFCLLAAAGMGFALLAMRARENHVRCSLLFAGTLSFLIGLGYSSSGSDEWTLILWSGLVIGVLMFCAPHIVDGKPEMVAKYNPWRPKPPPPQLPPPSPPPAATPPSTP